MVSDNHQTHIIEVWADYACFSRPELKIERFSYPCPTPSAARGVFDAIYVKPNKDPANAEFRWQITQIEILNPITYIALRRNEVSQVASERNAKQWMKGSAEPEPIFADDSKTRQQRQTMALRDVRYRLHGHIVRWPGCNRNQAALDAQFIRRAKGGKCFQQPYLGCREFVTYFRLIKEIDTEPKPQPINQDLGYMLYDVFDLSSPNTNTVQPSISLFKAVIREGVLKVPEYRHKDVRKLERRAG